MTPEEKAEWKARPWISAESEEWVRNDGSKVRDVRIRVKGIDPPWSDAAFADHGMCYSMSIPVAEALLDSLKAAIEEAKR
ncbi:MAG: hypothetical protein WC911_02160 [Thermoleophilia bacterium]